MCGLPTLDGCGCPQMVAKVAFWSPDQIVGSFWSVDPTAVGSSFSSESIWRYPVMSFGLVGAPLVLEVQ